MRARARAKQRPTLRFCSTNSEVRDGWRRCGGAHGVVLISDRPGGSVGPTRVCLSVGGRKHECCDELGVREPVRIPTHQGRHRSRAPNPGWASDPTLASRRAQRWDLGCQARHTPAAQSVLFQRQPDPQTRNRQTSRHASIHSRRTGRSSSLEASCGSGCSWPVP